MLEYSMIPYDLQGFITTKPNITGSMKNTYLASLSTLQQIADYLGDGFYAENHTLNTEIQFTNNSTTYKAVSGDTIPILKRQSYPNIGIIFNTTNEIRVSSNSGGTQFYIFDLLTGGTPLVGSSSGTGFSDYTRPYYYSIVNAGPNGKIFMGGTNVRNLNKPRSIIFLNNAIIGNYIQAIYGSDFPRYEENIFIINVDSEGNITSNKSSDYYVTNYPESVIQLSPIYNQEHPEISYSNSGVYVLVRDNGNLERKNFIKNGITYFSPGNSLSDFNIFVPILVLSDEHVNDTLEEGGE